MRSIVVFFTAVSLSVSAIAATEPEGVPVGGAELIPTIRIEHSHNDNLFSEPSEVGEESSNITRLKPHLEYMAEGDKTTFSATYEGNYGRYWSSRDDDYDDHQLGLMLDLQPNDFFTAIFNAKAGRMHDDRGTFGSEGASAITRDEPDEYDQEDIGVLLDFGRETARFGASVGYHFMDKDYTNNEFATEELDREESTATVRLYGRFGGKTKFFIEAEETDFDYDLPRLATGTSQDSDETTIAVGAEWEATAKTTGNIRVGRLDKDFDAGFDDDLTVWALGVTWSPTDYSHFSLSSFAEPKEAYGNGIYIDSKDYGLSWTHYWSDRVTTVVSYGDGNDDYPGITREDDRNTYSIAIDYDWRRWLNVGLSFAYDERDSNQALFDYERDIVLLHVDLSL